MLRLEGLNLLLDTGPALLQGEFGRAVLFALRGPVLGLVGRLEGRILADCGVCVRENLLDVL